MESFWGIYQAIVHGENAVSRRLPKCSRTEKQTESPLYDEKNAGPTFAPVSLSYHIVVAVSQ
jgi:hypothetical protein